MTMSLPQRVAGVRPLLLGLDFDGVLSELVDDPAAAVPVEGIPESLHELVVVTGVRVAGVSGRMRDDLAARFDWPEQALLVGEHGADAGGDIVHPDGWEDALDALERVAARFEGAWVEQKRSGLTLHGRLLSDVDADRLATLGEAVLDEIVPGTFERGNRVIDVRLTGATKGDAIRTLRLEEETVVYLGDDTTDETVFRTLEPGDIGVKVGAGDTAATERLGSPHEVAGFLLELCRLFSD